MFGIGAGVKLVQKDGKFVASMTSDRPAGLLTGDNVRPAKATFQSSRDTAQQQITGVMAVTVVDPLEFVEVQKL